MVKGDFPHIIVEISLTFFTSEIEFLPYEYKVNSFNEEGNPIILKEFRDIEE